jgi:hypothetical protein
MGFGTETFLWRSRGSHPEISASRFNLQVLTLYKSSWPHFRLESNTLKEGYRLRFQALTLCGCPIYGVRYRNLFWRSLNGLISTKKLTLSSLGFTLRFQVLTLYMCSWPHFKLECRIWRWALGLDFRFSYYVAVQYKGFGTETFLWMSLGGLIST